MLLALKAVATIGEMGTMARRVHDALWCIQPTEVEAERAFSAAGLFLTKLRMRMKDQTLDRLVFMRARLSRLWTQNEINFWKPVYSFIELF